MNERVGKGMWIGTVIAAAIIILVGLYLRDWWLFAVGSLALTNMQLSEQRANIQVTVVTEAEDEGESEK